MADLFSKEKKYRTLGITPNYLNVAPPEPSPSETPASTPSISVSPSVTPSITITPSLTPSVTITPSVTPSPNYLYLANIYNCLNNRCNQSLGQTTLHSDGFLTSGLYYTSSMNTAYVYKAVSFSNYSISDPPLDVLSTEIFTNCHEACLAINPSPSPTATPSVTPTVTATPSVTPTPSLTPSSTPSVTITPSVTVTSTPSITPSPSNGVFTFNFQYSDVDEDTACGSGTSVTRYSNSPTLEIGYDLTTDVNLSVSASIGYYCLNNGNCVNHKKWIRYNGFEIDENFIC
jgi:hypothetical protein